LALWDVPPAPAGAAYTTVTTWQNRGKDLTYNGNTYYWTKDREFAKFINLPHRRPGPFELAAGVPDDIRVRLSALGWLLTDSIGISRDVSRYRAYIAGSRAEFTV